MKMLDVLLERNKAFAVQQVAAGTLMPSLSEAVQHLKAIIIACADMRVDPADVLGLKPGEALVLRNIGGRVTPVLIEELRLLGRIGQVDRQVPGGGGEFNLIVLQHTDCGITRLSHDAPMLSHYFHVEEDALQEKSIANPYGAVQVDVQALRSVPALPAGWLLSGLVYDVSTGLIEVVVPPAQVR